MGLEEQLEKFFRDRVKVGKINNQKYPIAVPMYKTNSGLYEIYLIVAKDGHFYLSDEGATLKELDQIFELLLYILYFLIIFLMMLLLSLFLILIQLHL